ncbi:MAG TPA: hypothetical protein ENN49_02460 [Bacteroidales bacterium]|nr:hypothetical protein [Bacteroidales bacterium]
MTTCLVTDSNKIIPYQEEKFFNNTIDANNQLIDEILLGICKSSTQIAKLFNYPELLVVDTSPKTAYTIIANALRAGINVLTPSLLHFSSEKIHELITIAQEIGVELGFLPKYSLEFPSIHSPIIIESIRESISQALTEIQLQQITTDLILLLSPIKSEIRKVRVYWLPLYSQPISTLKLIVDFNDNTLITYQIKNKKETSMLKVVLTTEEYDKTFNIFETQIKPESTKETVMQNVDYFINQRRMIYPAAMALKSKQIIETILKKIYS